ncbi:MAG TPA: phosphatidate cytidylyltransferase [Ideonella sp.]|uniref:phosphatidate cytidylyltransferase n=1 Tax=Ideonella sp. TaxID=1929293 RepID=UPI002BFB2CBB|nr:phosphatidate cytidylyltransferase [Ideonella sp.]HSI51111.1 phosphatidate cytidylyltransferase [Ideonella sp.]
MHDLLQLSTGHQIGLLFVIVFGVLAGLTTWATLRSLGDAPPEIQLRHDRFVRELRAMWIGLVTFWLAWLSGPIGATLLFGVFSFLALREFITLMHTRRSDHRSLIFAFFIVLPIQYVLVGGQHFDLFSVFIPVYVFFVIPVISALAGDPGRFLERNAKIQWGIMVCVFGLSHAPALLLLDFPGHAGRGAFLLFFYVLVAIVAYFAQETLSQRLRRRPVARAISRSFSLQAWALGAAVGGVTGGLLFWITPFKLPQAILIATIAAAAGNIGEFVMRALKKDAGVAWWGNRASVTGAVGLLDRIAPLAFGAPVFFHSVRWYFKLTP